MSDDNPPNETQTGDLSGRVLRQIRDKIDAMGERLDGHDRRFDQVDARFDRVDARFDQIDGRFVEVEARIMTELHAVHATMDTIHTLLVDRLELRDRVARVEHDVAELKERL